MDGDFPQPRTSATAPASKMKGSSPTNQPHTYQQNNVIQHNGTYHQFDPSQAAFHPSGAGLERYQVPRTMNVSQNHNELVDLVRNHNIRQATETARLDHNQRGLAREFDDFRNTTMGEFEALKQQMTISRTASKAVEATQKQIKPAETTGAEAEYDYYHTGDGCVPSEQMLRDVPKEKIATTYLEEAAKREVTAIALRKQALMLCPELLADQGSAASLEIEVVQKVALPDFACCATEFAAIGELVEHVKRVHTAPEHRLLSQSRSKAVEIKSPPNEKFASLDNGHVMPLVDTKQKAKVSENSAEQDTSSWTPAAVHSMPPVSIIIPDDMQTFSFEFLRTSFGGDYWSPGFYFSPDSSILPSKAYWILDATHEPFLPNKPGAHGAKLTAFFNETMSVAGEAPEVEHYLNVPVFIKTSDKDEYSYFGHYSQLRFSDKISYDTIASVIPVSVLRNNAEQLAETGRPAWVTEALREHFWPKPKYEGPIPTDSALNSPATSVQNGHGAAAGLERHVMKGLVDYAAELKDWDKDSKIKVNLLTPESIFHAFSVADADAEPGLRLFWEYLQCVEWTPGFYKMLVGFKNSAIAKREIDSAGKKRRPSPDRKDGSTAAKMGLTPEATFKPNSKGKAKATLEEYPGPEAKTKFVRPDLVDELMGSGGSAKKKGRMSNGFGGKKIGAVPTAGLKGDLKAAKEFNASVKKSGGSIPPHLRARK